MGCHNPVLVSVIMPTYNCGKYIAQSIDSVISQTITDWEIQIVDDCSTDSTADVLKPYLEKYSNIHYYRLAQNGGPAAARTEAIKRATGKYCAFLDSDDLWTPDKLEKQIGFMEKSGALFSCTGYAQMDEAGKPLHKICTPPAKTDYAKAIRLGNPIGNLTVMYDQEALGRYEVPQIAKRNDFALWLRILRNTDCCYGMPDSLACYRVRKKSVSSNKLSLIKYHWQLYRDIERLSAIRSIGGILCWAFTKAARDGIETKKCDAAHDATLKGTDNRS